MAEPKWLDAYSGQTIDELMSLAGEYRIDSLVVALEEAVTRKVARSGEQSLTGEERTVLAVEALEREVNNGGYSQFFVNPSRVFAPMIVDSLLRIGCPGTAEITRMAIAALHLADLGSEAIEAAMDREDDERDETLSRCDESYYESGEDIAGQLFAFAGTNRRSIRL